MKFTPTLVLCLLSYPCFSDQYVSPYVRSDGTYVEGHMRSSPNNSTFDNYSSRGNTNPYTGERGSRNPYGSSSGGSGSGYGSSNGSRHGSSGYGSGFGYGR